MPAAVARHAAPPHRSTGDTGRPRRADHEPPPPRAAVVFADATLRRVLEVIDRRRPIAQLRPLLAPALIDTVVALTRAPAGRDGAAVLRRVRLRTAGHDDAEPGNAAEVFATSSASWSGRRNRLHQPKGITADHWNYLRLWADCGHGVGTDRLTCGTPVRCWRLPPEPTWPS